MLTKLTIRNFKCFGDVEVDLSDRVIFIGPNNSGKTTALQALTLWENGLKRWCEKRAGREAVKKRPGVTINRRDTVSIPHPSAKHYWHQLHTRNVRRIKGRTQTSNVRIDLILEGITNDRTWACGLEFDYANDESYYCRPLRLDEGLNPDRMDIPEEAMGIQIAFLPPMSGLATNETRLDQGAINVRIGEGRTAEVLRNLCFRIAHESHDRSRWKAITEQIESLFGVVLDDPIYVRERGEIAMGYREHGIELDLSSSGRGLQQTLLILAYMYENPNSIVLLDEPDAHLEVLRQRQIYDLIANVAVENGNQIIAASHSEVLLEEAADRDLVVAFIGKPHRLNDRGSQLRKALSAIGYDHYIQAEQVGWVLYLEGSTDLAILKAFARRLGHGRAERALSRPFVHYVGNQPRSAASHFHGLREASPHLKGIAIYDRLGGDVPAGHALASLTWQRREIENYLCSPATLEAYARASAVADEPLPLFSDSAIDARLRAMRDSIREVETALQTLGKDSPWSGDSKVSDDFLAPLFQTYFARLGLPNVMNKKSFFELVMCVPLDEIDPDITETLDVIAKVHESVEARKHDA